ncbi:MAG TPA: ATP-dependent DNA helicase RecQ [Chitinophagaceae bacterium]|nr:ATP-dependent DNA helicase RecQ [Chitinophagaceae bacterium]
MTNDQTSVQQLNEILSRYWGFSSFRPLQQDIIQSVLDGKDTLALLPTGGGKSICFQVPALAKEGLCLVISPLIALMKDQVENLRKKGITAFAIYSGMSRKEVVTTLHTAGNSNCKFLYVSPERLESSLFKEYLPGLPITLIAVDEAHCISQWGYDFRPPYLRIAELRKELPAIPVLALTASATPAVQKDICDKLQFGKHHIFRQSFERPNLSYSVFNVDSKINKLVEILNNVPGTGIVYCRSRKHCRDMSELLRMNGIAADFYHAGLTQDERNRKQQEWIGNKIRVMVCTNAFGMGIDKPDVRTVVHVDIPDCLENYYQEAGRAGRDGKQAYAVLLYHEQELEELRTLSATQFPEPAYIKKVYQSLVNYLQVPAGSGAETYYPFDLGDFIKKFGVDTRLTISSLKTLEQEEVLAFNEQVFVPSKLQFNTSKQGLHEFEQTHPALEPIIKTLLRTYEGIFDFPITISEALLAKLVKTSKENIITQLQQLHSFRLVNYEPQKDKPQVYFFNDRPAVQDLNINTQKLQERKAKYEERIGVMYNYVKDAKTCRSKFIANYFGDTAIKDCGICDVCLDNKSTQLSEKEFSVIQERIVEVLHQPTNTAALLEQLRGIKKEKAWTVINFLQAENKLEVDGDGMIRLKH